MIKGGGLSGSPGHWLAYCSGRSQNVAAIGVLMDQCLLDVAVVSTEDGFESKFAQSCLPIHLHSTAIPPPSPPPPPPPRLCPHAPAPLILSLSDS